jgi:hypothetical protein
MFTVKTIITTSLVCDLGTLVCDRVRISVKLGVYRSKTYERSLSTLNHGKPTDSNPDEYVRDSRVSIFRKVGLRSCNQPHDNDDGEHE